MVGIVQETSKEIVDLFYNMKKGVEEPVEKEFPEETPFITANYQSQSQSQPLEESEEPNEESVEALLTAEDNNIDRLKLKIGYMSKRDR